VHLFIVNVLFKCSFSSGSIPSRRQEIFQFSTALWVRVSLLYNGYHGPSLGIKLQWHVADHSLSSIAEAKNGGAIHPLHICLPAVK
jgi:hypothetical protein